ncbi:MAG: hypothetical protein KAR79_04765, partial [Simkaniaceae bacterium]|nr:hypothetical protein [Simkaniaceae bacterium]
MKSIIKYLLFLYETRIAPFIAIYLRIFLWPFYLLCKKYNYCFLINIASSPGHTTVELDHFL